MSALDRISKEYKDINRNPIANCGVTVGLFNEDDLRNWRVSLLGPKDTSYKGGLFYLSIHFPDEYPAKPPEVCFMTPIYHVNVNHKPQPGCPLGHICISTLYFWNPQYRIRDILTSIFALFYMGNPESPYGLDRAEEFRNNRAVFEEKIKYFTKKYANPMKGFKEYPKGQNWDFSL